MGNGFRHIHLRRARVAPGRQWLAPLLLDLGVGFECALVIQDGIRRVCMRSSATGRERKTLNTRGRKVPVRALSSPSHFPPRSCYMRHVLQAQRQKWSAVSRPAASGCGMSPFLGVKALLASQYCCEEEGRKPATSIGPWNNLIGLSGVLARTRVMRPRGPQADRNMQENCHIQGLSDMSLTAVRPGMVHICKRHSALIRLRPVSSWRPQQTRPWAEHIRLHCFLSAKVGPLHTSITMYQHV